MSLPQFNVPLVTPLPDITQSAENFRMDQLVRMYLVQIPQPAPLFANAAAMQSKANWDTLIAASDITHASYTPVFSAPKITPGKILQTGADTNATIGGIPESFGTGVTKFDAEWHNKDAPSMKSIDAMFNYSQQNTVGLTNLGAYFVNQAGQFFCNSDFSPIPIFNFLRMARGTAGFAASDIIGFEMWMPAGWDTDLICVIPSFNPVTTYTT